MQERGPPKSVTVEDSFKSCASFAAADKVRGAVTAACAGCAPTSREEIPCAAAVRGTLQGNQKHCVRNHPPSLTSLARIAVCRWCGCWLPTCWPACKRSCR